MHNPQSYAAKMKNMLIKLLFTNVKVLIMMTVIIVCCGKQICAQIEEAPKTIQKTQITTEITHRNLNNNSSLKSANLSFNLLVNDGSEKSNTQNTDSGCDFSKYSPIRMNHFPSEAVIKKVTPNYPQKARKQKIEDTVSVKILINENGILEKACAFDGNRVFWTEAEKAAMKWRFKPKYGLAFSVQRQDNVKKRYAFAYISFTFILPKKYPN